MYRYYRVEVELTEKLLGTQPTDVKARELFESREDEEVPVGPPPKLTFFRHEGKPVLFDYQIKGFFKEAACALPEYLGVRGKVREYPSAATIKGHMARWLFIRPRHFPLTDGDGVVKGDVDGFIEHPLRGMTRRGERVLLLESDYIAEGSKIAFTVAVLENCPITEEGIRMWLQYAEEGIGLLGWRTGGYGHFKVLGFAKVEKVG